MELQMGQHWVQQMEQQKVQQREQLMDWHLVQQRG